MDARTKHKVGVEHASFAVLQEALANATVLEKPDGKEISPAEFYELGLAGQPDSAEKRQTVSRAFHLGEGNAKYLRTILARRGITAEQVKEVLEKHNG